MTFVSVTRLRIRSVRFMPGFVLHALSSLRQCKQASGFQDGSLLPDRKLTFWTMTLWRDQAAMRAYMTGGAHLVREVLSEHLRLLSLPILIAGDGAEAIDLIEHPPRRFSVLVTDFHMPGNYHGGDVAAHMLVRHPHVHIFIATGCPDAAKRSCRNDLPVTIIEKPYSFRTLFGHIEHLIET